MDGGETTVPQRIHDDVVDLARCRPVERAGAGPGGGRAVGLGVRDPQPPPDERRRRHADPSDAVEADRHLPSPGTPGPEDSRMHPRLSGGTAFGRQTSRRSGARATPPDTSRADRWPENRLRAAGATHDPGGGRSVRLRATRGGGPTCPRRSSVPIAPHPSHLWRPAVTHHLFDDESEPAAFAVDTHPDGPPEGERWSSWDGAMHGPKPRPDWVITAFAAVDADLGVLKTGKEADVHVLRRWVPGDPHRDVVMAAKRFRGHAAPDVPPRRRLPRGAPGPAQPRDPRHGPPHRLRQGPHRRRSGPPPSSTSSESCGTWAFPCPTRCS